MSAPAERGWPTGVLNRDETLKILTEHNAWRRGAKGPQTDPRMLGLALDAAIEALASAPQPPSGGEVRAKPLEWQEDGPGEWCDRHHGFHITQDDEEPKDNRFTAAWGEGDPEWFPTLEEAQAWCQEAIDRYIREWADTAPPSAPVGVDRVRKAMASQTAKDGIGALDALYSLAVEHGASTTAAAGFAHTANGAFAALEGQVHDEIYRLVALAQQPAAVDGAVLHVARIGNYGAAYDGPGTYRAFTYEHQPGNVDAARLGGAVMEAANARAGDSIDRGLTLLKALQGIGFGVFQIAAQPGGVEAPPC